MILRLSVDNGILSQLCACAYLWQKMGLLQIQALQSRNNTTVQFLVTDSINRMQTKKGEKKCDSFVGRFLHSFLFQQIHLFDEPNFHRLAIYWKYIFLGF